MKQILRSIHGKRERSSRKACGRADAVLDVALAA